MCSWLQPYFSCCCEITASFVIQQLQSSSCVTYPHIMSALQLIQKVNEAVNWIIVTVVLCLKYNFFFLEQKTVQERLAATFCFFIVSVHYFSVSVTASCLEVNSKRYLECTFNANHSFSTC